MPDPPGSRFDDDLRHGRLPDDGRPGPDDQPPGYDEPREEADEGEQVSYGPA
jgi:hypothetical protein